MILSQNKNIIIFIIFYTLIATFLYSTDQSFFINEILTNIVYVLSLLLALIACIYLIIILGTRNHKGANFVYFTIGFLFWTIGELVWIFYDLVYDIDPFPSIADAYYLMAYPFYIIAFIKELKSSCTRINIKNLRNFLIPASILFLLIIYTSIYATYESQLPPLENILAITYGIGDIIILVFLLVFITLIKAFKGGKLSFFWIYLFFGFVFILFGDILFNYFVYLYERSINWSIFIDIFWIIGYLLIAGGLFSLGYSVHKIQKSVKQKIY